VNNPDWLADITVLHLATHSAGFLKPGGYVALNDAPGTVWRYSDAGLNWLADMLTDAFEQDLEVVLLDRVWSVLGVSEGHDVEWRPNALRSATNAAGFAQRELASGITINAQTMARVGLLFLREGKWGADAVFADNFDDIVRTPDPSIAALPVAAGEEAEYPASPANYGVLWWTNATGALPNVPTDAYWAWGQGDSLIVVIPSLDIVISRVGPIGPTAPGRVWGEQNWNGDYAVLAPFLDPIVQSVQ
jgi:CubicO group peptidase (beta-lactamase class C family)